VLFRLGERESATALLEHAVTAYRAALEERTRERVPLDWAYSQRGLGNALAALATRVHDPVRMARALPPMRNAAEVYRDSGNSYCLTIVEQPLQEIQAALDATQAGGKR
jgi:hypothetical protein